MAKENEQVREIDEDLLGPEEELLELDLPEDVQKTLFYSIDEATKKIATCEELDPFTMVLAGEDLFMDTHPIDEVEACRASAAEAVNSIAHIADAYVFCYDGYIGNEEGEYDMLISEVGIKGAGQATAYGLLYEIEISEDEDAPIVTFDEGLVLLGPSDNLFDPKAISAAEALQESYARFGGGAAEEDEAE